MKTALIAATAALLWTTSSARAAAPVPATEDEKTIYSLGKHIGQNLEILQLSPKELEILKRGLVDSVTHAKPAVDTSAYPQKVIDELIAKRGQARAVANRERGKAYLEKTAREKNAIKYDSGVVMTELKTGTGPAPKGGSRVTVNMRGTLVDGTEIDNTWAKGAPMEFPLGPDILRCWTEAITRMKPGGKARIVCPDNLAWGERGRYPTVPPGSTVVYEFELVAVDR